jgi:hypothetical protein
VGDYDDNTDVFGSAWPTTTSGATTNQVIWQTWTVTNTATTANTTSVVIWQTWAGTTGSANVTSNTFATNAWAQQVRQHEETREEKAAREKAAREYRERVAREDAERKAAKQRARALLKRHLDAEQREMLEAKRCFYVKTPDGRSFRIDQGSHGNVYEVDEKRSIKARYCGPLQAVQDEKGNRRECPEEDHMLAQMFFLKASPEDFFRVANRTQM